MELDNETLFESETNNIPMKSPYSTSMNNISNKSTPRELSVSLQTQSSQEINDTRLKQKHTQSKVNATGI